ncbi:hypothetical protein GA0061083_1852 [Pseudarthrobacter enclensis]|uniref:Uncharacterized protein n=1 Tax=Pseudarthrobacter enclensis TaxID=993070 RepID=A0A0V8IT67_9MICC|nr:hypothetical protein [Pseudarthrobacter enclensis]KSU77923.1 hypothetical protein AS031_07655 [Pseudarthrobacter enclensis]SCB96495.1 hypothetical protein GA0061083_1852 [Pseudarthrobacter enclensis]
MPAEQDFFGPMQYSPAWMWVAVLLLALTAAWFVFVFASSRRPGADDGGTRPAPLTDLAVLKAAYLQRIEEAERAAAAGTLSARAAHQDISHLLRCFVRDATGVDAPRMTLADLERHPLPSAAAAVGAIYPGEFAPEPLPPVAQAAARARDMVGTWN